MKYLYGDHLLTVQAEMNCNPCYILLNQESGSTRFIQLSMYGSRLKVELVGDGMECLPRKQERPIWYLKMVTFYLQVLPVKISDSLVT